MVDDEVEWRLLRWLDLGRSQMTWPYATEAGAVARRAGGARRTVTSRSCDTVTLMRPVSHDESERMRDALKTIASFLNPAKEDDGGQAAARLARKTLDGLDLFIDDSRGDPERHAP